MIYVFIVINKLLKEWNQVGSAGCKYLSEAISNNPGLQLLQLDLRNNGIDSEGAVYLADSMSRNKSLTYLDLRWNRVIL